MAMTRQCVKGKQKGVEWQMKIDDARTKLVSVYHKIKVRTKYEYR